MFSIFRLIRLLLLCLLPLAGWAQSSLPPCAFFTLIKHDCYGERTYPGGAKYIGEFRDNKRHGKGRESFPSGDHYVGEFRNGKRNGQGIYTNAIGEKYVGEFRDDKRNGQGIEFGANEVIKRAGQWSDGSFVPPKSDETEVIAAGDRAELLAGKPSREIINTPNEDASTQSTLIFNRQQLASYFLKKSPIVSTNQLLSASAGAQPPLPTAPSASYGEKIVKLIRDNIKFTSLGFGQSSVVVLVLTSPEGRITQSRITSASGNRAFDEAVLRGIQKLEFVPQDDDGRVPAVLVRDGLEVRVSMSPESSTRHQPTDNVIKHQFGDAVQHLFGDVMSIALEASAIKGLAWKDRIDRAVQEELSVWLTPDASGLDDVPMPVFPEALVLRQEAWESNAEFEARVDGERRWRREVIDRIESEYRLMVDKRNRRVEQYNQSRRERELRLSEYRRGLVVAGMEILAPTPLLYEADFDQKSGALTILSESDGFGKQAFSFIGTSQAFRRSALTELRKMKAVAEFQVSDSGDVSVRALTVKSGSLSAKGFPSSAGASPVQLASVTLSSATTAVIAQQSAVMVDRNQVEQILYREENESLRKRLEEQRRQQEQAVANAEARAAAEIARIRAEADAERKKLADARPVQNLVSVQEAHALVIGNSAYPGGNRLANPVNDATAMSEKLRSMGFKVTEISNANRVQMVRSLSDFTKSASRADLTLLFYAGHGVQIQGVNYMVPIDMSLNDPSQATLEAVSLTQVVEQYLPGKTKLVFLDACRDNPLMNSGLRGVARGLAPISVSEGTLISYATKDGQTASDGVGARNSPFTAALLEHLGDPNDIAVVLRKVREKVMLATGGKQQPWEYGSLTGGELVLARVRQGQR